MSTTTTPETESEMEILARWLGGEDGLLSVEFARSVIDLQIGERDQARMHDLITRNQGDALTPAEQAEMFAFAKAGTLLSILKSKARRTLGVPLEMPADR